MQDMKALIERELAYFDSDEQRSALMACLTAPHESVQAWQYGDELHVCTVVATDGTTQIVYCTTGFGPSFPWSVQRVGEKDLGMDADWDAYLYETFVRSRLWPEGPPKGFMLMGPGERDA